jgi:hypothetical protein
VHHGFGSEARGIRRRNADGGLTFSGDSRGETLIQQSGKDHYRDISRFAIRDAQTARELAFDAHALQRGGEEPAATVHDKDFVASVRERYYLARQVAHHGFVFE